MPHGLTAVAGALAAAATAINVARVIVPAVLVRS